MTVIEKLSKVAPQSFSDEWYKIAQKGHFWFSWRLQVLLRELADIHIPRDSNYKVFDIGCGAGLLMSQLEECTSWRIDGCDINKDAILKNEAKRGCVFFYNIHDRNVRLREAYDLALVFDVLEHIPDTGSFLESVLYHVKKRGILFINVPALPFMQGRYDCSVGHLRRYSASMLREELAYFPVRMLDIRYWGFSMLPLLIARKYLVSNKKNAEEIVKKGMATPNVLMDLLLKKIMRIEMRCIKRPPLGTSLMAIFRKECKCE